MAGRPIGRRRTRTERGGSERGGSFSWIYQGTYCPANAALCGNPMGSCSSVEPSTPPASPAQSSMPHHMRAACSLERRSYGHGSSGRQKQTSVELRGREPTDVGFRYLIGDALVLSLGYVLTPAAIRPSIRPATHVGCGGSCVGERVRDLALPTPLAQQPPAEHITRQVRNAAARSWSYVGVSRCAPAAARYFWPPRGAHTGTDATRKLRTNRGGSLDGPAAASSVV